MICQHGSYTYLQGI